MHYSFTFKDKSSSDPESMDINMLKKQFEISSWIYYPLNIIVLISLLAIGIYLNEQFPKFAHSDLNLQNRIVKVLAIFFMKLWVLYVLISIEMTIEYFKLTAFIANFMIGNWSVYLAVEFLSILNIHNNSNSYKVLI